MAKKGSRRSGRKVRDGETYHDKGYGEEKIQDKEKSEKLKRSNLTWSSERSTNNVRNLNQNIKSKNRTIENHIENNLNHLSTEEEDTKKKLRMKSREGLMSKIEEGEDKLILDIIGNLLHYLQKIDVEEQRKLLKILKSITDKGSYDLDSLHNFILEHELFGLYPKLKSNSFSPIIPIEFPKEKMRKERYDYKCKLQKLKNKLKKIYDGAIFGNEAYYLFYIIKCLQNFIQNGNQIQDNQYDFLDKIADGTIQLHFILKLPFNIISMLIDNLYSNVQVNLTEFNKIMKISMNLTTSIYDKHGISSKSIKFPSNS